MVKLGLKKEMYLIYSKKEDALNLPSNIKFKKYVLGYFANYIKYEESLVYFKLSLLKI